MSDTEVDVRGADGFGSVQESYRRAVETGLPVYDYVRRNLSEGDTE